MDKDRIEVENSDDNEDSLGSRENDCGHNSNTPILEPRADTSNSHAPRQCGMQLPNILSSDIPSIYQSPTVTHSSSENTTVPSTSRVQNSAVPSTETGNGIDDSILFAS